MLVLLSFIAMTLVYPGCSTPLSLLRQEGTETETDEVSCVNVNFINKYGKPFKIWKTMSPRKFKGFIVKGKNYKLKTMVGKSRKNKPIVYHAVPLNDDSQAPILLDGRDYIRVLPFDCDEDFVNVTVSSPGEMKGKQPYMSCKFIIGGNTKHNCCHFPFVYRGRVHRHCFMGHRNALWCGTTANYDVDPQWGYCCY